jgi:Transcriptional Coactivator p15 (PC4)
MAAGGPSRKIWVSAAFFVSGARLHFFVVIAETALQNRGSSCRDVLRSGRRPGMEALVARIPKNPTEEVRVALTSYRGHDLIDIRVFFQDEQGEWRPTKRGVSLSVDSFTELREAIAKAEEMLNNQPTAGKSLGKARAKKAAE